MIQPQVLSRLDGCMYAIKAAKRQAKGVADRDRMLKEVHSNIFILNFFSRGYRVDTKSFYIFFATNIYF